MRVMSEAERWTGDKMLELSSSECRGHYSIRGGEIRWSGRADAGAFRWQWSSGAESESI